jgi:threonine dehydrogenase-like Zn-dependent dehydrogenase
VSSAETSFEELAEMMGNVDLVYEAVGHSHFALEALRVLGQNGIFILTGVPGLEALTQSDPAALMRSMVLKNQVLLGTVNAGRGDFAAAIDHLGEFVGQWPEATRTLIAGRYPLEESGELIFGRPVGVKSVVAPT